jgi:hypothetical protein
MNAHLNGSGRSRGGPGPASFLALGHTIFSSGANPGCFVYRKNYEFLRRLTVKACIALVQGGKVRLRKRLAAGFTDWSP